MNPSRTSLEFEYNLNTTNSPNVHFTFDNTDHAWMNCSNCISNYMATRTESSPRFDLTKTHLTLTEDYKLTCGLCNNKSRVPIFTTKFTPNMKHSQTDDFEIAGKHFKIHWFRDDFFVFLYCDKCREHVKLRKYNDMHCTPNCRKIVLEASCGCKAFHGTKWHRYRSLMHDEISHIPYEWSQIGM